ncbi:Zinc finger A20 and AN1 domain-containing stress-associated protein 4 [Linum grandiflorum]
MAEEHRCEAQEGHRLCVNNCGFFGSPTTMDLCSKCYGDYCVKEQQQASIKASLSPPSPPSPSSSSSSAVHPPPSFNLPSEVRPPIVVDSPAAAATPPQQPNRCSMCRKRVGLTGFKCRCGITFCGVHRYPEKHSCDFDFKKAGREEIARANPLVIAQKLEKI